MIRVLVAASVLFVGCLPAAAFTASLTKQLGPNVAKPIPVSSEIVAYLDPKKRLEFLSVWKAAVASGK